MRSHVFIGSAPKDQAWLASVRAHLLALVDGAAIDLAGDPAAGPARRREIEEAIAQARVAILLLSSDFLASDFVAAHEVMPLLRAAEGDGLTILPLRVGPCLLDGWPELSELPAFDDRPLDELAPIEQEKVLAALAERIRQLIAEPASAGPVRPRPTLAGGGGGAVAPGFAPAPAPAAAPAGPPVAAPSAPAAARAPVAAPAPAPVPIAAPARAPVAAPAPAPVPVAAPAPAPVAAPAPVPVAAPASAPVPVAASVAPPAPASALGPALRPSLEIPRSEAPQVEAAPVAEKSLHLDDDVQFTVYRPRAVVPGRWKLMLAFAHLSARRNDADPDEPDPIDEVRRQAHEVLGADSEEFQSLTQDATGAVPEASELTFLPEVPGVEFNPPRRTFRWLEPVQREEFRLRASPELSGRTARGHLAVFLGGILIADVPLTLRVDAGAGAGAGPLDAEHARAYRRIFASYSRRDTAIVQQVEQYGRALGDSYLRDVVDLRAGQVWNDELRRLIDRADVFQLFWSRSSMASKYVRDEWEYALSLGRPRFVRPTYWEDPLPEAPEQNLPPETLRRLNFQRIALDIAARAAESAPLAPGAAAAPRVAPQPSASAAQTAAIDPAPSPVAPLPEYGAPSPAPGGAARPSIARAPSQAVVAERPIDPGRLPQAALPGPSRRRRAAVWAAPLVGLAAGVLLVPYVVFQLRGQTESELHVPGTLVSNTKPPLPIDRAKIRLTSVPAGASVTVDGTRLTEVTPTTIAGPVGARARVVIERPGYAPLEMDVLFERKDDRDDAVALNANLEKEAADHRPATHPRRKHPRAPEPR